MNEIYATYFKNHFPARAAFGATGLALNARVEIDCIAVVNP
jgi:2-iminobutanoate/2-iminopropanoate deaminase